MGNEMGIYYHFECRAGANNIVWMAGGTLLDAEGSVFILINNILDLF